LIILNGLAVGCCENELLRDQTLKREVKISALRALGDLAVNCGEKFS